MLSSSRRIPVSGCTEPERDQLLSINDTHVFNPHLVNEGENR